MAITQIQTDMPVSAKPANAAGTDLAPGGMPLEPQVDARGADAVGGDEPAGHAAWPSSDLARRSAGGSSARPPVWTAASTSRHPQESSEMFETATAPAHAPSEPRKPSKLITDLAAAMRSTAIAAREQAIAQVELEASQAEAAIRARSTDGAEALRHRADEDINAIREWSKAEIARIRAETDARISDRKAELDGELAGEAEAIEQRVFEVHAAVAAYQEEMASFFERLLREDDPARLATMAETMPEPPALATWVTPDALPEVEPAAAADATVDETAEATDTAGPAEATDAPDAAGFDGAGPVIDADAVWEAAIAARIGHVAETEAESAAEPAADATPEPTAVAVADPVDAPDAAGADEPAAGPDAPLSDDERSLTARLASLLAHRGEPATQGEPRTSRVIVTGLVSVASIASYKRHLARIEGVSAVSVSSGPGGEFVFNATHRADLELADILPGMQGFTSSVTGVTDGTVYVTARDPEADS